MVYGKCGLRERGAEVQYVNMNMKLREVGKDQLTATYKFVFLSDPLDLGLRIE